MVLQDIELDLFYEVPWVESMLSCHPGVVDGYEDKGDEQDADHYPERYLRSAVKGVNGTAKGNSHGKAGAAGAKDEMLIRSCARTL